MINSIVFEFCICFWTITVYTQKIDNTFSACLQKNRGFNCGMWSETKEKDENNTFISQELKGKIIFNNEKWGH